MQKKKAEQAWIDSVLEQAFPDKPKAQKEPYLTYEELMEGIDDKTPNGQATGMAVGVNNLNEFKGVALSNALFYGNKKPSNLCSAFVVLFTLCGIGKLFDTSN